MFIEFFRGERSKLFLNCKQKWSLLVLRIPLLKVLNCLPDGVYQENSSHRTSPLKTVLRCSCAVLSELWVLDQKCFKLFFGNGTTHVINITSWSDLCCRKGVLIICLGQTQVLPFASTIAIEWLVDARLMFWDPLPSTSSPKVEGQAVSHK